MTNNDTPNLHPDLKNYADYVMGGQRANPNSECFSVVHVDGVGWRLISARTGKEYTPESYYEEFGVYPRLPHPENLPGVVKPKFMGFGPKTLNRKKSR